MLKCRIIFTTRVSCTRNKLILVVVPHLFRFLEKSLRLALGPGGYQLRIFAMVSHCSYSHIINFSRCLVPFTNTILDTNSWHVYSSSTATHVHDPTRTRKSFSQSLVTSVNQTPGIGLSLVSSVPLDTSKCHWFPPILKIVKVLQG